MKLSKIKQQTISVSVMIWVHDHKCVQTRACRHIDLCLALSLSKQSFYSERLQWSGSAPAKTPFHTSSLPFCKPSSCVTAGPSFLPSSLPPDTEAWGSHRGVRMAGCTAIRCTHTHTHPDRLTRTRHADRRMPLLLLTLDSVFLLIRSHKESDIIPVLLGQQEGRGRQRAAGCVGERMKKYEGNKRKHACCSDRVLTMHLRLYASRSN